MNIKEILFYVLIQTVFLFIGYLEKTFLGSYSVLHHLIFLIPLMLLSYNNMIKQKYHTLFNIICGSYFISFLTLLGYIFYIFIGNIGIALLIILGLFIIGILAFDSSDDYYDPYYFKNY